VIATEWQEFAELDFKKLRAVVRAPIIIDLRNFLNEEEVERSGFSYFGIGGRRRHAFETVSPRLVSARPFWAKTSEMTDSDNLLLQRLAAAE
jgi:hypothetical protein